MSRSASLPAHLKQAHRLSDSNLNSYITQYIDKDEQCQPGEYNYDSQCVFNVPDPKIPENVVAPSFGCYGERGPEGPTGKAGQCLGCGFPGPQGGIGQQGKCGLPGQPGRPGPPGRTATTGLPGEPGLPGPSGITG